MKPPSTDVRNIVTELYYRARGFFDVRGVQRPAPIDFHRKLPAYAPTSLREAPTLAERLGIARVWVKDESMRFGLPSFKILGASWAIYHTIEHRFGPFSNWSSIPELAERLIPFRPLTVVTASDGNHGRAVARFARLLGLESHVFLPTGTAQARIASIVAEGGICEVVDGTYDDAVAKSAASASASRLVVSDTSWPGYEAIPERIVQGYMTIFDELDLQLAARRSWPDVVLVQAGVGALAAGAGWYFCRPRGRQRPLMLLVEPESAACILASMKLGTITTVPGPHESIMAGLNCGTPSLVGWPVVSSAYDVYMAIHDDIARDAVRILAVDGIVAGETGAAGAAGALAFFSQSDGPKHRESFNIGDDAEVLVIVTEGVTDPVVYAEIVGES